MARLWKSIFPRFVFISLIFIFKLLLPPFSMLFKVFGSVNRLLGNRPYIMPVWIKYSDFNIFFRNYIRYIQTFKLNIQRFFGNSPSDYVKITQPFTRKLNPSFISDK